MEYKIIKEDDKECFSRRINRLLDDGWKLHGETKVLHIKGYLVFYIQAMTLDN